MGREVLPLRHGVYGAPQYLESQDGPADVILFRGETEMPSWVTENYPDARVVLQVDDVGTILTAVRNGLGVALMPCYIGDSDTDVRRIDLQLTLSDWGIWILSNVYLRSTARVRVCREFLIDIIQQQRALVLGERSRYFG